MGVPDPIKQARQFSCLAFLCAVLNRSRVIEFLKQNPDAHTQKANFVQRERFLDVLAGFEGKQCIWDLYGRHGSHA